MNTCQTCSAPLPPRTPGRGRPKQYCGRECWPSADGVPKMASGSCTICGANMLWSSAPAPVCTRCRRGELQNEGPTRAKRQPKTCMDCDAQTKSTRCRPCYDAHVRANADPVGAAQRKRERAIRQRRDRTAPGLTMQQRRNLGTRWRRQGRRCTYCEALATQVDHVIPLALGGTNYEGNLTPCCASCNVRKSDSLLIEWKWKVRRVRDRVEPPPLPIRVKRPKAWPTSKVYFLTCWCGDIFTARTRARRFCTNYCGQTKWTQEHRPPATPNGTMRSCETCCQILVIAPKRDCESCAERKARAAKARARKRWKQSPGGRASRRRYEERRRTAAAA